MTELQPYLTFSEAAREYEVDQPNLSNWVRYGYIRVLDQGLQRPELGAVDVFKRAKGLTGSSIKAGWVLKRVLNKAAKPIAVVVADG